MSLTRFAGKVLAGSYAVGKRLIITSSSSSPSSQYVSSSPSLNVNVVKLQECPEEFDEKIREAKFAFRSTDLGSWNSSSRHTDRTTDMDPTTIQHWALVVHFPRGNKTYLFEAWKDEETGLLQAGRAEGVDYQVFTNATYFGTIETSPSELLEKAKQVPRGEYDTLSKNCQTWLIEFVRLFRLSLELFLKVPVVVLA